MGTVMQVGTLPWLLRHELRLWWRELSAERSTRIWLVVLVVAALALVVFLWNILASIRQTLKASTLPEAAIWIAVAIWFVGFFYTFYQAVEQSIVALFDRGDLDSCSSAPPSTAR